jgi:hypothetical protein
MYIYIYIYVYIYIETDRPTGPTGPTDRPTDRPTGYRIGTLSGILSHRTYATVRTHGTLSLNKHAHAHQYRTYIYIKQVDTDPQLNAKQKTEHLDRPQRIILRTKMNATLQKTGHIHAHTM